MIQYAPKKRTISYLINISFILFISFVLGGCPSNQKHSQQKIAVEDNLNTGQTLKEQEIEPIINQETKKKFVKPKPKPVSIFSSSLPDFTTYKNVKQKKNAFFSFLAPLVQNENEFILKQRQFIEEEYQLFRMKDTAHIQNNAGLKKMVLDYRCRNTDLSKAQTYEELLIRVDIIPQELALVQAALESSWGSSYFARVANNLFGQWCFKPNCGVIPRARKKGETHEVAKFKTPQLSVKSYMLFLNSHPAFSQLRKERAEKRKLGEKPEALSMANGLKAYSARGEDYIAEIKSMIRINSIFFIEPDEEKNALGVSKQKEQ